MTRIDHNNIVFICWTIDRIIVLTKRVIDWFDVDHQAMTIDYTRGKQKAVMVDLSLKIKYITQNAIVRAP
jgi:hypothetical protein